MLICTGIIGDWTLSGIYAASSSTDIIMFSGVFIMKWIKPL